MDIFWGRQASWCHVVYCAQFLSVLHEGMINFLVCLSSNDAFIQALHDLGYRVGQNATLVIRFPTGPATLSALAHELLQFQPDVIVTSSPASMEAVRQATTTVPIGAEDLERDSGASGLVER